MRRNQILLTINSLASHTAQSDFDEIPAVLAAVHAYAVKAAVADFGFSQAGRFKTGDEFRMKKTERQHDGTDESGPVLHVFLQRFNRGNDKIPRYRSRDEPVQKSEQLSYTFPSLGVKSWPSPRLFRFFPPPGDNSFS